MLKKIHRTKLTLQKMVPFFLLRAPTHHRFTSNLRFLFEMKHKVRLFKSVQNFLFSIPSVLFLLQFMFLIDKKHGKVHTVLLSNIRFLSCKKKFFSSIWVFFHIHSRFTGQHGKGEALCLTPLYHFHPFHRLLDISRVIAAGSSLL